MGQNCTDNPFEYAMNRTTENNLGKRANDLERGLIKGTIHNHTTFAV